MKKYAGLLLRIGLALLFIHFGIKKFTELSINVTTFENLWLVNLIPFSTKFLVLFTGVVEIILACLLLAGFLTKFVALASAGWTFLIFIQLGYPGGVYDLALSFTSLALFFTGPGKWSLEQNL